MADSNQAVTQAADRALRKLKSTQRNTLNDTIKDWNNTHKMKKSAIYTSNQSIRSAEFFKEPDPLEQSVNKFQEVVKELHKPLRTAPCTSPL